MTGREVRAVGVTRRGGGVSGRGVHEAARGAGLGVVGLLLTLTLGGCVSGVSSAPAVPPTPQAEPEAIWHLFDSNGAELSLTELVDALTDPAAQVEVVFVGERHGDPGIHAFQAALFRELADRSGNGSLQRPLVLSLEMFEWDVQEVLNEYLADLIREEHFLAAARPWPNYARDYRPSVELAKERGIPVVAANAPRRYVNRVSRLGRRGLDDLPESALRWLPPLPYPEPSAAYRAEWDALMAGAGDHGMGESALHAQSLWDAGMALAISRALDANPGALVLHFVGGFHVENGTGTPEALEHYRPGVGQRTVAGRPSPDPAGGVDEALRALGDYILLSGYAPAPAVSLVPSAASVGVLPVDHAGTMGSGSDSSPMIPDSSQP